MFKRNSAVWKKPGQQLTDWAVRSYETRPLVVNVDNLKTGVRAQNLCAGSHSGGRSNELMWLNFIRMAFCGRAKASGANRMAEQLWKN